MTAAADLFRLGGRIAFVSGAAGHLGRPMARVLCEAGAHVILNGRSDAKLKEFEAVLRGEGHSVERAAFDVSDFPVPANSWRRVRASIFSSTTRSP